MTYSSDPEKQCETKSASICSTTTSFGVSTTGTVTRTTATATSSTCQTVYGCDVKDSATATATTSVTGACPLPTKARRWSDSDQEYGTNSSDSSLGLETRQADRCGANAIVYPADPEAVGEIPKLLAAYAGKYVAVGSSQGGFTSFYWVPNMDAQTMSNCTKSVCTCGSPFLPRKEPLS